MELDLLGVPLGLELPVVGEDLVDDGEHVAGALLVVSSGVYGLGRRPRLLERGQLQMDQMSRIRSTTRGDQNKV